MSATSESLVLFDVDTQVDFMCPSGRLYVPGAEQIVPNLERLMNWAGENDVPVISTADAHRPDDPEFKIWPPHCVIGTPGQRLIPETLFPTPTVIPGRPGAFQPPALWVGQFIVEKPTYTPEDNPNFGVMLRALGPRRAVVFGVTTEFCVRAVALSLCARGFKVDLVSDAIKPITEKGGDKALEELKAAGARLIAVAEVVNLFAKPPVQPATPR